MAQQVKNLPVTQETQETRFQSLGREDPLEKEMATHSSILAWKIPQTESLVGYSPRGHNKPGMTEHIHSLCMRKRRYLRR